MSAPTNLAPLVNLLQGLYPTAEKERVRQVAQDADGDTIAAIWALHRERV